ncbi:hypothetical protein LTR62_007364 [Meristemomyces frigidus]|uniref:Glutaminase n=1 Tax=Meristemomyces frigidus TaxID=1508187 RepID=A0AAN7YMG0_9PEZI|nr:hypothetical protein LTR62_007364 [Meristemomyces frigidus]
MLLSLLPLLVQLVQCTAIFVPVQPPSYPLAVRNPYLNAWVPGDQVYNLPYTSAQFWNGVNLTWSVIARVNEQSYSLFGVPSLGPGVQAAVLEKAEYTATHSTFFLTAGEAFFVLDFLSPISPANLTRQSTSYSYLTVSASPNGGARPKVSVYTDMDNTWIGQFSTAVQLSWDWKLSADTSAFSVTPQGVDDFTEVNDIAQWGTAVYCGRPTGSMPLSLAVGEVNHIRADHAANGTLEGSSWDWVANSVMAYSQDMGTVTAPINTTFAIGYLRTPALYYDYQERSTYFEAACRDEGCGCTAVLDDFAAADAEARTLDAELTSRATAAGGSKYSDIVTLSARQAFGAMDITIPSLTLDTSNVMAFVKEISSDGNVNTIDVIYPMPPMLYVMAPNYIRMLLEPNMEYLATGAWPDNFPVHDIGSNYPNATGHNDGKAEYMPAETTGDLLTLACMYASATGDNYWFSRFASLFQTYADYLVAHGLHAAPQMSSDDSLGVIANQTGLGIKSAIALNAYGVMSGQSNYSDLGRAWAKTIYNDQLGTDAKQTHFTCIYGEDNSWGLQYNLFQDALLDLQTFPTEAYAMQTKYYRSVRMKAGLPLNSLVDWGKTDWMSFGAATAMASGVANEGVRDMFVNDIHAFISNGQNAVPFSDKFHVQQNGSFDAGKWDQYRNRPVVGGHFALLAMGGAGQF